MPVLRGVPPEALAAARSIALIAGRPEPADFPVPKASPAALSSTIAPLPPALLTTSASEFRRLKHSHITHKQGAKRQGVARCAISSKPRQRSRLYADPSERLGAPQTEAHMVGWRARETWVHGARGGAPPA